MTITRLNPGPRYSDAVSHQGVAYLVEVPATESTDFAEQMSSLLECLDASLARVGSSKTALLMATIYLCDMADYTAMNSAWEAWLPAGCAPSRACVQVVRLAQPGWRVEVAASAAC